MGEGTLHPARAPWLGATAQRRAWRRRGARELLTALVAVLVLATTAHHLLQGVRELHLPHSGSPYGQVTCSIGVACVTGDDAEPKALFEAADRALYEAKKTRNEAQSAA